MTESAVPSRIKAYVWAGAAVFVAAVVAVAGALAWNARQAALADSEAQATRFVAGAEAALNRSLLAVDVLLASMDELLGLSNAMTAWVDADTASQRLRGSARQNLMVRYVAVLDGTGRPWHRPTPLAEACRYSCLPVFWRACWSNLCPC